MEALPDLCGRLIVTADLEYQKVCDLDDVWEGVEALTWG